MAASKGLTMGNLDVFCCKRIGEKSDVTAPERANAVMMLKPLLHIILFNALFVDKTLRQRPKIK